MADCHHGIEEAYCGDCTPRTGPGSALDTYIDVVSLRIPGDGEAPISFGALVTASQLSPGQVTAAVAAIRERHPDLPLVSDRNGIRFTMDEDAVRRFRNTAARTALTRIRRAFRGALLPYLEIAGTSDLQLRLLIRQFNRALEDIGDLVDANSAGH
jgi:hypothetical protein